MTRKIIIGILLVLIAGAGMFFSLRYDNYRSGVPFGTSSTGKLVMTPAVGIYFLATILFVTIILPIEKIKKMPPKKKFLVSFIFVFIYIYLIFFIIFGFAMFYVFVLPKITGFLGG